VIGGGLHAPALGGDHEPGAGGAHPDDEDDAGEDAGVGDDGTVAPTGDPVDVAVTALGSEAAGVSAPSIVAPQRRHVDHAAGIRKPQPGQVLTKSPRGGSPGAEILSRRDAAAA
jgi:hypothetical protein